MSDTETTAQAHRREIGNDFADGWYYDACSCGWESDVRRAVLADLQSDDSIWRQHVAQLDGVS